MTDGDKVLSEEYQKKNLVYFQLNRHEMLKYIPKGAAAILDVGCGCGNFGRLLKDTRPVEVWGVELNEDIAAIAAQNLDRVFCGSFDSSLTLASKKFDCIVFNDVLEHLVDPFSALIYSQKLLQTGGVVVASIPNIRYFDIVWDLLVNQNWKYTDSGILDRTHLRFFTKRSLLETFDNLGYSVDCIEGINPIEAMSPLSSFRRFRWLNRLLFNQIEDMRYFQFAIVARPRVYPGKI